MNKLKSILLAGIIMVSGGAMANLTLDFVRIFTNSADGVSVDFKYTHHYDGKEVKYLTAQMTPYNSVGDKVKSTIHYDRSSVSFRMVGPLEQGVSAKYTSNNLWYNGSVSCVTLDNLHFEFMDGSEVEIKDTKFLFDGRDLNGGYYKKGRLWYSCDYKNQKKRGIL